MDKKKIGLMALLAVFFVLAFGAKEVLGYDVANPTCAYRLVGPSNVSDAGTTQNTTFKAVIQTTSNQTSSQTFVRLINQNSYTLFTNQTGRFVNETGETASYEATWAAPLDASQTYSLSAAWFFLNNTFYNYSITQVNCPNRTFTVNPVSGGFVVTQEAGRIQEALKGDKTILWIAILAALVIVIWVNNKK